MMYEIGYGVHLLINQEKKERKEKVRKILPAMDQFIT